MDALRRAAGEAWEFVLGLGDLADAIKQHLGPNPANRGLAEIPII